MSSTDVSELLSWAMLSRQAKRTFKKVNKTYCTISFVSKYLSPSPSGNQSDYVGVGVVGGGQKRTHTPDV